MIRQPRHFPNEFHQLTIFVVILDTFLPYQTPGTTFYGFSSILSNRIYKQLKQIPYHRNKNPLSQYKLIIFIKQSDKTTGINHIVEKLIHKQIFEVYVNEIILITLITKCMLNNSFIFEFTILAVIIIAFIKTNI